MKWQNIPGQISYNFWFQLNHLSRFMLAPFQYEYTPAQILTKPQHSCRMHFENRDLWRATKWPSGQVHFRFLFPPCLTQPPRPTHWKGASQSTEIGEHFHFLTLKMLFPWLDGPKFENKPKGIQAHMWDEKPSGCERNRLWKPYSTPGCVIVWAILLRPQGPPPSPPSCPNNNWS